MLSAILTAARAIPTVVRRDPSKRLSTDRANCDTWRGAWSPARRQRIPTRNDDDRRLLVGYLATFNNQQDYPDNYHWNADTGRDDEENPEEGERDSYHDQQGTGC